MIQGFGVFSNSLLLEKKSFIFMTYFILINNVKYLLF